MTKDQARKIANVTGKVIMFIAAAAAYKAGAAYMNTPVSGKKMLLGAASAWLTGRLLGYAIRGDFTKEMNDVGDAAYEISSSL